MEGVPSDGWMSDFRTKWLPEAELAELMMSLERWALTEKMTTLPGMKDECRVLFADGSKLETHAEPPRYDEDGNLWNEWRKDTDGNVLLKTATVIPSNASPLPRPVTSRTGETIQTTPAQAGTSLW